MTPGSRLCSRATSLLLDPPPEYPPMVAPPMAPLLLWETLMWETLLWEMLLLDPTATLVDPTVPNEATLLDPTAPMAGCRTRPGPALYGSDVRSLSDPEPVGSSIPSNDARAVLPLP